MLTWCSYCQQFQGEAPPYDDLRVTHGVCAACEPSFEDFADQDLAHARMLIGIQAQLAAAGRDGDLKRADGIIDRAVQANVRPVDILVGVVAPMLCQTGKDWEHGVISVADEHRFTCYCEGVFGLIMARVRASEQGNVVAACRPDLQLLNAPGNQHTLGIRILALWLENQGLRASVLPGAPGPDEVIASVLHIRPKLVVISMALAEQWPGVEAIAERIATLPEPGRPLVVVGGNAVKLGLVAPVPGIVLETDIGSLEGIAARWARGPSARRSGE